MSKLRLIVEVDDVDVSELICNAIASPSGWGPVGEMLRAAVAHKHGFTGTVANPPVTALPLATTMPPQPWSCCMKLDGDTLECDPWSDHVTDEEGNHPTSCQRPVEHTVRGVLGNRGTIARLCCDKHLQFCLGGADTLRHERVAPPLPHDPTPLE